MLTFSSAQTSSGDDSRGLRTKETGLILSSHMSLVHFPAREPRSHWRGGQSKAPRGDMRGLESRDK